MHIDGLDELDRKILSAIEKNARLSYSEIGNQVGVSRVSVKNRMDALEEKGIIGGYFTKINPAGPKEGRRFFIDIITEPGNFEKVADFVARDETIRRVFAVTGESRLKAEGFASTNAQYETFMRCLKQNLEGMKSIAIQDAQFTIKDMDGGVEYVGWECDKEGEFRRD